MKLRARTLRIYQQVHTWSGLLAGFALFIAFYAGALSVFRNDIDLWQHPPWRLAAQQSLSTQALLDKLVRQVPEARNDFGLMLPEGGSAAYAYWFDKSRLRYLTADPGAGPGDQAPNQQLADFIYALHYSLGASTPGLYLMGVVSLLYGLALVSGVIIHLPTLLPRLFTLRPGHNLKRLWSDAHNAIGVLSLPFHIIFALTGALFCLSPVLLMLLGKLAFGPQLPTRYAQALATVSVQPTQAPAGNGATRLPVQTLLRQAELMAANAGSPGFRPTYLHFVGYGQARAHVEITGLSQHTLAIYDTLDLALSDGHLLATSLGPRASLNHALASSMYGLHFGNFGGRTVQWLYFILGLAGAFLFYSGNLLWLESRRKRRHQQQPRRVRLMAGATVGVCLGSCLGISVAFAVSWLGGLLAWRSGMVIPAAFFGTVLISGLYASVRPIAAVSHRLCLATAAVSTLTATLHLASAGRQLWAHRGPAALSILAVDLIGLTLGLGFLALAHSVRRRARHGDPNSIWASP